MYKAMATLVFFPALYPRKKKKKNGRLEEHEGGQTQFFSCWCGAFLGHTPQAEKRTRLAYFSSSFYRSTWPY